ncbi:heterokaryon incompatibility protein 6, OR allele [Chaetomidium leptoderma]|uniref:Heterokaryon incompatibility protein 6, OR allele n=1 Tax=Chaetomidium leptoderma TaxID=669021 RepID=A0AAN6ZYT4_9PEZI|nr:heterokaryon incompatibility protein 6, OR allele [Chaetomidium leptoderma]
MAPAFPYQPLPLRSIRVIKLLPARSSKDTLKCTIKDVQLDNAAAEPYEALSYVWGEPTRTWPLDCGGKALLVTRNCHEALINLRNRFLSRTLWIDAICINQADTDEAVAERNTQIPLMGDIYRKATCVLVWLGPATDSFVSTLFRHLRFFHFLVDMEDKHPRLDAILSPMTSRLFEVPHDWESFCMGYLAIPRARGQRDPATDLLLTRWRLYLSTRMTSSSLKSTPLPPPHLGRAQVQFELQLLAEIRNMKATVPHDRVYSLYALFQTMGSGVTLPSPDYKKPIGQVFEEATIAYIRGRQNLDIIAITPPPERNSGFPSWVPDWLTRGRHSAALIWKIANFDAQPPPTTTTTTIIPTFLSACFDWRRLIDTSLARGRKEPNRMMETILLRTYHGPIFTGVLGVWYRWMLDGCHLPIPPMDDAVLDQIIKKRKPIGNQVIFVLDTGYYGTAHHVCRVGDAVAVLHPVNPLILRPQETEQEYRIVTPAYCYGAMNGEMGCPVEEQEKIILV